MHVDPKRIKPMIGLIGGIGAGKSAVADVLRSLGATVIDSDRLVHQQLGDPAIIRELASWWGSSVLNEDGTVDRRSVARIVFGDPIELKRLEALLYPKIETERRDIVARCEADPAVKAVVLDAPKLVEVGLHKACDAVIFVHTDRGTRIQRLLDNRGWSQEEMEKREKLMDPLDKKMALADYVVENHAGLAELRSQVEGVFSSVLKSFP